MAAQSVIAQHAEWLSLVEVSGPFLSFEVLKTVFPQGLPKAEDLRNKRERLSSAYEEWLDNQGSLKPDPAIHRAWLDFVLRELLEWDAEIIREGQGLPASLRATVGEHGTTLTPTLAAVNPTGTESEGKPRVLVRLERPGQGLEKAQEGERWKASPATRMMTLLHATGVRLGLVTNGEQWMLVHAVPDETTTYVSFYANLFAGEEPLTLRALASLLDSDALWGRGEADTTESLFARSKDDQFEVTDQLGSQARRAVETLIQSIDRIDRDRGRQLLKDLPEQQLYEAAVTIMMRLVFLLCAEERSLLLLGDPLYDQHYAVSTLREQLQEQADRQGKDVLARRHDAFSRLLATFRAVHGGVRHDHFHLPAYGGSLFDPDRFPFLEGRDSGTHYRDVMAQPLPIDNLTVLDLLNALTLLEVKVAGALPSETRRLSFRGLDVEQIGHVYEGLLDHTAKRAKGTVVSLQGKHEPEVPIEELYIRRKKDGEEAFLNWLEEKTGRSANALGKGLQYKIPSEDRGRWLMVCDNKPALYERVVPWAGLVRQDAHQRPVIYDDGAVYVTEGTDRRATGTHYTPRSMTEPIVRYTLEPLVYEGPAEGKPNEEWKLKPAAELLKLKICDLAMGSGAFLVEVTRYLSARVVEAWEEAERAAGGQLVLTPEGELTKGDPSERLVPTDAEERLAIARRVVADRCVYGVDKNPMAVEMAKLSLWLVTLQKDKPFTFLDHALRHGDSLLGLTDEEQIRHFHIDPSRVPNADGPLFRWGARLGPALSNANRLRNALESFSVDTLEDARKKERLLHEAEAATSDLKLIADLVIGAMLETAGRGESALDTKLADLLQLVTRSLAANSANRTELQAATTQLLNTGIAYGQPCRIPFHWALEFPEVTGRAGFDAIVGNPPFMGGRRVREGLGSTYRDVLYVAYPGSSGNADLCAFFLLRAGALLRVGGQAGLLATNTISQGDTRETGLDRLVEWGFSIPRAVRSRPWPGPANLEVAHIWLRRGNWGSTFLLDDARVEGITSQLSRPGSVDGKPYRLAANAGKSFQGSIVLGLGFLLEPAQAEALIRKDSRNKDVLFPYLNGQDLNSSPTQSASRWVINFFDWPLDRDSAPEGYKGPVAADYPECLRIIEERVKPERQRRKTDGTYQLRSPLPQRWWHYADKRPGLYRAIKDARDVLVCPIVTKYLSFVRVPNNQVFMHKIAVHALQEVGSLALLSSEFFELWARLWSSTLETRLNYSPSDAFETFPLPQLSSSLADDEVAFESARRKVMQQRGEGLTAVYNAFHDKSEKSELLHKFRDCQVRIGQSVALAYGWHELDMDYGFRETELGPRFTVSETTRREILDRLLRLNHERYAKELDGGLHEKQRRSKATAPTAPSSGKSRTKVPKNSRSEEAVKPAPRQIGFNFGNKS